MDTDYSWGTDEMFDNKLRRIAARLGAEYLLGIPGVYELVREDLNNEVLTKLEEERDEASASEGEIM